MPSRRSEPDVNELQYTGNKLPRTPSRIAVAILAALVASIVAFSTVHGVEEYLLARSAYIHMSDEDRPSRPMTARKVAFERALASLPAAVVVSLILGAVLVPLGLILRRQYRSTRIVLMILPGAILGSILSFPMWTVLRYADAWFPQGFLPAVACGITMSVLSAAIGPRQAAKV
ncbi:MAG: hypothetical protein IH851_11115 [Armatimonadetes bacterium]|nr:hypothetical protein [Armatimonadota bacterium]